uniref:SCP domain-containing protein n=1 Tax=Mycena chlorophos TaxID=658473 RepID=A0ABQ0L1W4_MYCCL|nr:predicted protein [Mycena chlorophos]
MVTSSTCTLTAALYDLATYPEHIAPMRTRRHRRGWTKTHHADADASSSPGMDQGRAQQHNIDWCCRPGVHVLGRQDGNTSSGESGMSGEITGAPEDVLGFNAATAEELQTKWTVGRAITDDPWHANAVQPTNDNHFHGLEENRHHDANAHIPPPDGTRMLARNVNRRWDKKAGPPPAATSVKLPHLLEDPAANSALVPFLFVLFSTVAVTTVTVVHPRQATPDAATMTDADRYLAAHNAVRDQHGANALAWDTTLAANAHSWADNCQFLHSGQRFGPNYGENIAAGSNPYGIESAIDAWCDEEEQSEYYWWHQLNHFTQVVWKSTTHVGCAYASCPYIIGDYPQGTTFHVCQYSPAGNREDWNAIQQNVQ